MTSRRIALVAALACVGAGAAVFALAALHRPPQRAIRLVGGPVATQRTLTPSEPQFGDPVVATIDVFVDTRRVDPAAVTLTARFAPFSVLSTTRSTRRLGDVSIVRVVERLECLDPACVPQGGTATFRLPRVRIAYPGGTLASAWPAIRIHARVPAADLVHPMLRVAPPQAHTTYRLPPGPTGWALIAVAIAAALGGLALVARAALPSGPYARRRRTSPLEQLLAQLANGNGHGAAGRRATLEELARALEPFDESLSFESRVLAWAPRDPEPDAVSDLARRVRAAVER